jgi:putative ABC transport system permease protein
MIATAWYVVRRGFRGRAVPTLGLVLMIAVASGSVAGLVAGARRTSDAFPAFVEHARATGDATVFGQVDPSVPFFADDAGGMKALLQELPEVERVTRATMVIVEGTDRAGDRQRLLGATELDPGNRRMVFGRPLVVEGTWPSADDPDAVAIDEELAARAELEVGDTYRVAPYTIDQFGPAGEGADVRPEGPAIDARVQAIYRQPVDLQPVELDQEGIYVDHSELHFSPAYWTEHGPDLARYGVAAVVDLAPGATRADLQGALQERIPDQFVLEQETITGSTDVLGSIEDAILLQARAMLAVAAVTGVTGAALIWLLLGRKASADRTRDRVFDDLGLGRGRTVVSGAEGFVIGAAGASLGLAAAVVSSHWMPFGIGGRAELTPGVQADVPVLAAAGIGAVVVVVLGAVMARRRAMHPRPARSSRLADSLARRGLSPVPTTGVRLALQSERDGGTVPVRAAFAGVALATGVIVAVVAIGASMDLVKGDPARRGAYGDAVVGNAAFPEAAAEIARSLDRNEEVAAYNGETPNVFDVDGEPVWVVSVFEGKGSGSPLVVDGRVPEGPDEIALGSSVLDRLDVSIGDEVDVSYGNEPIELEIVGQALVEDVDGANGGPGKAGIMDAAALEALDPEDGVSPTWFVVRFHEGVEHSAAVARLEEAFPNAVTTSKLPADLENLERLRGLVVLLAVLVGILGSGAALLAMVGAVSRRRRELAVLRTLGFARRQAAGTVAWQATTFALVGLGVGLPLGLVAGRRGWIAVAEGVGLEPSPVVPLALVAALAIGTIVLLNVVAAAPAWLAARVRPADVLRAE